MDRNELYRECAIADGVSPLNLHPDVDQGADIDRVIGGAWVTCQVYVSNQEVSELISHERRERRVEATRATRWDDEEEAYVLRELADTPRRGDI